MTARVTLIAATLLLISALSSEPASACTCVRNGNFSSHIRQAYQSESEVFSARVLHVRHSDDGREAFAEIEVLEVWKGSLSAGTHLTVSTMPRVGGMSCALSVVAGQEVVTYTSESLRVSKCTTHVLSETWGERERRLLAKLRKEHLRKISVEATNTSLERKREK
jgi:hypothetical protein